MCTPDTSDTIPIPLWSRSLPHSTAMAKAQITASSEQSLNKGGRSCTCSFHHQSYSMFQQLQHLVALGTLQWTQAPLEQSPGLSNGAFFFFSLQMKVSPVQTGLQRPAAPCATQRWATNFKALGSAQRLPLWITGAIANTSELALQITRALSWACLSTGKGFSPGSTGFHSAYLEENRSKEL